MIDSTLEAASLYVRRGLRVVPLPRGSKKPNLPGWQHLRIKEEDLAAHFAPGDNIGLLLGEPSGGLVDVDLDAPEALAVADAFLPPTGMIHGRAGKPRSHRFYVVTQPVKTRRFTAPDTTCLVEIRSTGAQTMVPPSIHPSGEPLSWADQGEPAPIDAADLMRAVGRVAASALIARYWAGPGSRHDAALALAGLLLRGGWSPEDAELFIEVTVRAAHDEEWRDRVRAVRDTAESLEQGQPTTGRPRLATFLGDAVVLAVTDWLGLGQGADPDRPAIHAAEKDLARIANAAWDALVAVNTPPFPHLYRRAGLPARVETGDDGEPLIREVMTDRLRHLLARIAWWYKVRDGARVAARPPADVMRDMLARPDPPLPVLTQIVRSPTFSPDGHVHLTPGYDPLSKTFYAPIQGFEMSEVPPIPSEVDVAYARDLLLGDLLGDFPFVGDAERAHAVAFFLLLFVRALIDGPTPLHLIDKPTPGTGASLLAEVLAYPALGRSIPVMTEAREEEEWRKRITATLLNGPPAVLLDNLRRKLDSPALASAITALVWNDRLLGHSEVVRVPARCVWVATGNNPTLSSELARRTIRIRLDAQMDRPWERITFRHQDLPAWVRMHRADLVWAGLTLGQAWIASGRPPGSARLGGFESWSRTMDGILAVAGIPGFLTNLEDTYQRADPEGEVWRAFTERWWDRHADHDVGVADLWALVRPGGEDEPLDLGLGEGPEHTLRSRFGKRLSDVQDRQFGPYRIIRTERIRRRARLWRLTLVHAAAPESLPPPADPGPASQTPER